MRVKVPVLRCPTCDTAYVLRVSMSPAGGPDEYVYQRDCKHKTSPTGTVDVDDLETAILSSALQADEVEA